MKEKYCFFNERMTCPNDNLKYIFVQNEGDCVYYPSEIFTGVIKCLRTAYYLLREMFSFDCALVDLMHKQEFPFLCNNQKPSLILNKILKESYRSGLKVETWGISLG